MFQKFPMTLRQSTGQCFCELPLFGQTEVCRRCEPIGKQGLEPAELFPSFDCSRIAQKLLEECLVVSLEENRLVRGGPFDQTIEHPPRIGSSIDIVSEKNLDWPCYRPRQLVAIDKRKYAIKEVRTTVHI